MPNQACLTQARMEPLISAAPGSMHAAGLTEAAQAIVRAVAAAAQSLDWLEADTFTRTLQDLLQELGHVRVR